MVPGWDASILAQVQMTDEQKARVRAKLSLSVHHARVVVVSCMSLGCVCRADACRARKTLGATAAPCTIAGPLPPTPPAEASASSGSAVAPPPTPASILAETKVPTNAPSPVPPTPPPPPSPEVKPPSQTPTPEPAAPPAEQPAELPPTQLPPKGPSQEALQSLAVRKHSSALLNFIRDVLLVDWTKSNRRHAEVLCRSHVLFEEWHHALVLEFGRGPDGKDDLEAFSRFVERWVPGLQDLQAATDSESESEQGTLPPEPPAKKARAAASLPVPRSKHPLCHLRHRRRRRRRCQPRLLCPCPLRRLRKTAQCLQLLKSRQPAWKDRCRCLGTRVPTLTLAPCTRTVM